MIDSLESQLNISSEELESIDPNILFQQLSTINESLDQFTNDAQTDDLHDQLVKIKTSIDAVCDTTQDIVKNEQEIRPYIEVIKTQLTQAVQSLKPAKATVSSCIDNLKEQIKEQEMIQPTIIKREIPEVSKGLICISEAQEQLFDEIIKKSGDLTKAGQDPSKLLSNLQNTSTTLTALAGTIADAQSSSKYTGNIVPQLVTCKNQLQEIGEIIKVAEANDIDLSAMRTAQNNLALVLKATQQSVQKEATPLTNIKPRKYQIVLGNDQDIGNVVDQLGKTTVSLQMDDNKADIAIKNANQTLQDLIKSLEFLKANQQSDQARLDAISSLQHAQSVIIDTISELQHLPSTPQNQSAISKYSTSLQYIQQQLDLISTKNITPMSVAKVNDDLQFLLNHENNIFNQLQQLPQQQQIIIQSLYDQLRDTQYKLQQQQANLQANACSGEAIENSQKLLIDLKRQIPTISANLGQIAQISNDTTLPVICERMAINLNKAINEPDVQGENLAKCKYVIKLQEASTTLAKLINELAEVSEAPIIAQDYDLSARAKATTEKAQKAYLDMVEVRNKCIQNPYSSESIDMMKQALEQQNASIKEVQMLARRIADATQNINIEQMADEIITDLDNTQQALPHFDTNKAEKATPTQVLEPPTLEQAQTTLTALNHLFQLTQYYAQLPEVSSNPELMAKANNNYQWFYQKVMEIQGMGNTPNEKLYEIAEELTNRANEMHTSAMQIPVYASTPNLSQSIPYALSLIQNVKPTYTESNGESLQDIKASITSIKPQLQEFKAKLQAATQSQQAQENKLIAKTFNDWIDALDSTAESIDIHTSSPEYNLRQATLDKEALISLQSKVNLIPINVRRSLDKDLVTDLTNSMANISQSTLATVNNIRSLPTSKKIEIDMNVFPRIDNEAEIEEAFPVIKEQSKIIDDLITKLQSSPQITQSPNTQAVITQMKQLHKALNLAALDQVNEQQAAELLAQTKTIMPQLISDAELIAPVADTENLTRAIKQMNDSASSLTKMITVPHMNSAQSTEFIKNTMPQLQHIQAVLQSVQQSPELATNPILAQRIQNLSDIVSVSIKELPTLKPRRTQQTCDDIYAATCATLPLLYDSNLETLEEAAQNVALITECYTALPKQRKPKTEALILREPCLSENAISSIIKQVCSTLQSNTNEISPEVYENLAENIYIIHDHLDSVPSYLERGVNSIIPLVKEHNPQTLVDSARIISTVEPDWNVRNDYQGQISVSSAVSAASMLQQIQSSIKYLQEQIAAEPEKFTPEARYYSELAQKTMKNSDSKLLLETKSLPATILNIDSMHDAASVVSLLLNSVKDNEMARAIVQPLQDSHRIYTRAIQQADMALYELFMTQLDRITSACDITNQSNPAASSPEMKQFIHTIVPLLKSPTRSTSVGPSQIMALAQLYKHFTGNVYPTIKTMQPEQIDEIQSACKELEPINALINNWAAPLASAEKADIRNAIVASTQTISEIIDSTSQQLVQRPDLASYLLSTAISQLQQIQVAALHAKNIGVDTTQLDGYVNHALQVAQTIDKASIAGDSATLQQSLQQITQTLEPIREAIQASCPIDFHDSYQLNTQIKDINVDLYLTSIADDSCLSVAKTATAMLNNLKTKMATLKTASASTDTTNGKEPEIYSVEKAQAESLLTIELNPIMAVTSMDPQKLVSTAQKSLQLGSITAAAVPVLQQEKVSASNASFMLAQRVEALREKLLVEFPDVIKRLNKPADIRITEDMVNDAVMSIGKMSQQFTDTKALKETMSRLTPDQVLVQQLLLNYTTDNLQNNAIDLPIAETVQGIQVRKAELIKAASDAQAENHIDIKVKTPDDVNRAISRGFSTIKLLETLLTVQQQMISNSPEICKFVHSPEGQQILRAPIEPSQILDIQQQIIKCVDMADSPENLAAFLSTFTTEQLLLQQRITNATLNLLSSDELFSIISDQTTETNINGVLKAANVILQSQIKADKEATKLSSLIDIETVSRAQETINSLLERMQAAQALMTVQSAHEAVVPNLHKFNETVDASAAINPQLVKQCTQMLQTQTEYLKQPQQFAQVIAQMRPEDIQVQQAPITYLAAILATAPQKEISVQNTSSFQTTANTLMESIQNNIAENISNIPHQLENIKGIDTIDAIDLFAQHEKILQACSDAQALSQIVKNIRGNTENIDQMAQSGQASQVLQAKLNDKSLDQTRKQMIYLADIVSQGQEELDQAVKQLTQEQKVIIFSLLQHQLVDLKDLDKVIKTVKEKSMQSRLFDCSLLIQAEPRKGISNKSLSQALPDVATAQTDLAKSFQSLAEAALSANILTLMKLKAPKSPAEQKQKQALLAGQAQACTLEKLQNIQKAIYQQLYIAGTQPEQLSKFIAAETPEDSALSLALLQHLSMLGNAPQYVQASSQGINFVPTDTMDTAVVDQTTQVNATTIASRLIQYQLMALQNNPASAANIPLPIATDLVKISDAGRESLERSKLKTKMTTIQAELLTKMPEVATAVSKSRQAGMIKINITPEEIKEYQGDVKALVGSNMSNSRILLSANNKEQDIVKKLAVLHNLIEITAPKQTMTTTFSDVSKLESLFDVNIDATVIPTVTTTVSTAKPRSELMSVASAAQTAADLLPILAHFSALPLSECQRIFTTENQEAIDIIEKLMSPKTQGDRDNLVQQLSDIIPQLVASLTRVIAKANNNPELRAMLVQDPAQILQITNEIQTSSVDLSKEENAKRFRQMNSMLLQILKNLNAGLSTDADTAKAKSQSESLATCANLVKAIKTRDIGKIHSELIDLRAAKTQSKASNTDDFNIDSVISQLGDLEQRVQQYYIVGADADQTILSALQQVEKKTIDIINKETPNPFAQIEQIQTPEQLDTVFLDSRSKLESATSKLVSAVQTRNSEQSRQLIADIIKSVADSQAAMFRGFDISGCQSTPIYTDYMSMIGSSMNAIHSIIDIGKTSTVSSTAIRRSTRSFNRMINSMIDMMEDRNTDVFSAKPSTPLEQARLQFIKDAANSIQTVISTVATNAAAKIPESFQNIMSKETPRLESTIKAIAASAENLKSVNTDKQLSDDFTNEINALVSSLSSFQKVATNGTPSLDDVTQQLIAVSDHMQKTLAKSELLTDQVQKVPDLESAEKIPQSFPIPPVPDTSNTNIKEAFKLFEQYLAEYIKIQTTFNQYVAHPAATNAHFVQIIFPLYQQMEALVTSLLTVSATTLSLDYQQSLTSAATSLVKSFDDLLHSLKDKFLLRGDFDTLSRKVAQEIQETIQEAHATATKALEQALKEESIHAAIIAKYMALINPLKTVLSTLERKQNEINKTESSTSKELASSIIKPCNGISQALNHLLLFSKSHTDAIKNSDEMLQLGSELIKKLSDSMSSIEKISQGAAEPEGIIATSMKPLAESGLNFTVKVQTNNAEAKKLIDVIKNLCQAAKGLALTSEQALNKKKSQQIKKQSGAAAEAPKTLPKSNLLKRLELESRVIKARTILERSEKKLESMK